MSPTLSHHDAVWGELVKAMQRYWGYDQFLPLQAEAMTHVLRGRDSVVVMPTGGGKSLCFQVPAVCREGMALVVSPLISLMKDQVDALRSCGVPAAHINSTLSVAQRRDVAELVRRNALKLLYVAPERLLATPTLEFLRTANVSLIAIDEAHCISTWGHDFRPEYRGLHVLKQTFPQVGVHAFTATASQRVRNDIAAQLGLSDPAFLVGNFDRPNLVYRVSPVTDRFSQICDVLGRHRGESGIVYCISRKEVERTAAALTQLGFRAAPYHAGLADDQRRRNQDEFRADRVEVMVATVAFGMGIDKSNVRFVVHAGMPKSIEHYQQESGRAGRDGLEAECCLFFSVGDAFVWRKIIGANDSEARDGALRSLEAMRKFCESFECRHRAIVRHFGQDLTGDNCGACDVCLQELDLVEDSITLGQKILSCVTRLQERYGADYTAKVLAGSNEERILRAGHDQLSTYGILSTDSSDTIRSWIEQLVAQQLLERVGEYQVLHITPAGRRLLKRDGKPRLYRPALTRGALSGGTAASWDGVDRELFAQLRDLRASSAAERGVSPDVVFSDTVLRELSRRRPSTREALARVPGVGTKKLDEFGSAFLEQIRGYCQRQAVAMDVAPPVVSPVSASSKLAGISRSSVPAFEYFRQGASIDEVAKRLDRAHSTTASYLLDYLKFERVSDPAPWVPADVAKRIEQAIEQVGFERLKPIHEHLQGKIGYDEIRIVVACYNNRNA